MRQKLVIALLYISVSLFTTIFFLRPLSLDIGHVSADAGDSLQQIWTIHWIQHATLSSDTILNAPSNYPYDKSLALYQPLYTSAWLTLPFYSAGFTPLEVYNLAIVLSFFLATLGVALCSYTLTGNMWAGLVAGVGYSFSTTRIAHIPHLNLLSGFWIGWILLVLFLLKNSELTVKKRLGLGALLSGLLAAQMLADIYHAIFLGVVMAFVLLYAAISRAYSVRAWATIGVALACALLMAMPILVPSLQSQKELQLSRTFDDHIKYAGSVELYSVRWSESLLWEKQTIASEAILFEAEDPLWPGLIVLAGAGLSLVGAWRRYPWYWAILGFTLFAALWSLGPELRWERGGSGVANPLYELFYNHVPLIAGVRVPPRWGMLAQLGLSLLAGYGIAWLLQAVSKERLRFALTVAVVVLALIDGWNGPLRAAESVAVEPLPAVYSYLQQQAPSTLLEFPLENADETLSHRYVYYGLHHPHRLVNGANSITPDKYMQVRSLLRDFPSAETIEFLQYLGVEYININRWELSNWPQWQERLSAAPSLELIATYDERHTLYRILPAPSAPKENYVFYQEDALDFIVDTPVFFNRPADYYTNDTSLVALDDARGARVELALPSFLSTGVHHLPLTGTMAMTEHITLNEHVFKVLSPPQATTPLTAPQVIFTVLEPTVHSNETLACFGLARGASQAEQPVLSLALVDDDWTMVYKQDRFFEDGMQPPASWGAADWAVLPCDIPITLPIQPGTYYLAVGIFDAATNSYLDIVDASGEVSKIIRVPQPITVAP